PLMHQRLVVDAHTAPASSVRPTPSHVATVSLALLDVAVVVAAAALAMYLIIGPYDAAVFSVSGVAKPFLQTLVLGAVRAGIRRPSWLSRLLARARAGVASRWAVVEARVSWAPAMLDAAFALAATRLLTKGVGF